MNHVQKLGGALVVLMLCLTTLSSGLSASVKADRTQSPPADSSPATIPTVTVIESSQDGLVLDLEIAGLTTSDVLRQGKMYRRLNLPYSGATTWLGKPEVPTFGRFIAIPQGAQVEVEVLEATSETISDVLLHPAQAPQTDCRLGQEPPAFVIDEDFYRQYSLFPGQLVMVDETRVLRGCSVGLLRFFPYQYNPATRELTSYSHLKVRVRFRGAEGAFIDQGHRAESFESLYRRLLINYDQLGASEFEPENNILSGAEFLIITHPDFELSANDLAAWRNANGISTLVRTTNETGSTAADIQVYIQNAYDTWSPAPEFVMFLGDNEWIPTNYSGGTATDLYYFTVDGPDYYPDIHGGRVSVDTPAEAQKAIDAIIDYEQNPVEDEAFYENVSVAAYFQDDEQNGYESRRFVRTSEEIRDYLMSQGYTVERIYVTEDYINPTHYNDGSYGNGEPLPPELLRANGFPWDGDAADISAAVEAGRFILNHRDHGAYWGWGDPHYTTSDVLALNNGNRLPIVFSMNCQSGWFDHSTEDPCFAEAWLRNPNGGGVGVVSATRNSYSGYNDWMTEGMYDAIWPEFLPEFIPGYSLPERRMGVVLNYGKLMMEQIWGDPWGYQQLEFELFHYFGDPTMRIHTGPPFADFTLSAEPSAFEACLPEVVTSTITVGEILTYPHDVSLAAVNVPAGVTADIDPVLVTPPGQATLTLTVSGGTADGTYTIGVSGTAEITNVHTAELALLVSSAPPDAPVLLSPADGAVDVPRVGLLFEWSDVPEANAYELQVDDDPGFGSPEVDVSDIMTHTYTMADALTPATTYYWRVRATNGCGQSGYSTVFDFTTETLPCILLVDDDDDSPDVLPYYTAALDNLGYSYDLFDVGGGSGSGPSAGEMAGYSMVIWFSGDKYGSSAGPNGSDETNLTSYLDGGGHLFLSSQDYLYDFGLTPFGESYLGIASYNNDDGDATSKVGLDGDPIGDGLGPYTLSYPTGFYDYGDTVNAASAPASQAFQGGNNSRNLDVDKDGGAWKTVFFGTSWVPVAEASGANGEELLDRIITWFGGCGPCEPVAGPEFVWEPSTPRVGETATFSGTVVSGTPPINYGWNFGDGQGGVGAVVTHAYGQAGAYTVWMTATNCGGGGVGTISHTLTVSEALCQPVTGADLTRVTPGTINPGDRVDFTADISPDDATKPYSYTVDYGDGVSQTLNSSADPLALAHTYAASGTYGVELAVWNCDMSVPVTDSVQVEVETTCVGLSDVIIGGPSDGYPGVYTFTTSYGPPEATPPIGYLWDDGGTAETSVRSLDVGTHTLTVTATNCSEVPVSDTFTILIVAPDVSVSLSEMEGRLGFGESHTQTLTLANLGTADLTWRLSETPEVDWLSESPISGTLVAEDELDVVVSFEASELETRIYTTSLRILSNDPDEPEVNVPVTLTLLYTPVMGVDLSLVSGVPLYPGDSVQFSADILPDDASKPYTYTLDYGDGVSETHSSSVDPLALAHTYIASGTYRIEMAAWNGDMSVPVTDSLQVVVTEPVTECVEVSGVALSLVSTGTLYVGDLIDFSADVVPDDASKPYTYTLDYGDGVSETHSSSVDPLALAHTYTASGTYTVELAVWNCDMSDPVTDSLQVMVTEPVTGCVEVSGVALSLVSTGTLYVGDLIDFNADVVPDEASKPYTYTLDYGDGVSETHSSSADPLALAHTYTASGTYTVELAVWNCDMTQPVTDSLQVVVPEEVIECVEVSGVVLTLVNPGTLYVGDLLHFSVGISPDDAAKPYTYTIDYGDGSALIPAAASDDPLTFSHTYAAPGTYTIAFAAWNCDMTRPVTDSLQVRAWMEEVGYTVYLPLVLKN